MSLNGGDPDLIVLSALAHAVASTGPPDVLYSAIAKNAVAALDAQVAHVWINDATARKLVAAGSVGVPAETELGLMSDVSLRHGTGIPGHIVVNGVAEFIEDAHDEGMSRPLLNLRTEYRRLPGRRENRVGQDNVPQHRGPRSRL